MALRINKARVMEIAESAALPVVNDPQEAMRLLEQVFLEDPANTIVFNEFEALCRQRQAMERLKSCLLQRLNAVLDPEALNRLGVRLYEEGSRRQALRCFDVAIRYGSKKAQENRKNVQAQKRDAAYKPLDPDVEAVLRTYSPKLSACLIVKNEEQFLEGCLKSLQGAVDEVIVVDTGSTDQTVKIAKRMGAKVYSFTWINDFSAARNESLRHASGDWILIIDADERLDAESKALLHQAIAEPRANSYFVRLDSTLDDGGVNTSMLPRLFRRHENAYYTGLIHEQIQAQLEAIGYRHVMLPVRLIHEGYHREVIHTRDKHQRNLELLERQLRETPDNHYYQFQLGKQLMSQSEQNAQTEQIARATELLQAACDGLERMSPLPTSSGEFFLMLAKAYHVQRKFDQALEASHRGCDLYPDYPDTRYYMGLSLIELQRYREAIPHFQRCRGMKTSGFLSESDDSLTSWRPLWAEGHCLVRLGDAAQGVKLMSEAQAMCPQPPHELVTDLALGYMALGQFPLVLGQFYALPGSSLGSPHWQDIARAHFGLEQYQEALDALDRAESLEGLPADSHCLRAECHLWLGAPDRALLAFRQAQAVDPMLTGAKVGAAACHLLNGDLQGALDAAGGASAYVSLFAALCTNPDADLPQDADAVLEPLSLLTRHALKAERFDFAEAVIQIAMRHPERLLVLIKGLAEALLDANAAEMALDLLQALLPFAEHDADLLFLIGVATQALGQHDLAQAAFHACKTLDPMHRGLMARGIG